MASFFAGSEGEVESIVQEHMSSIVKEIRNNNLLLCACI
ncbi:hypothetical protein KM92DES2_10969 [uncultured Desulfovibrio sp.]|uniref:Uncharacterized protein n=1 Tax=uncultured Desulfovibrio sp. TaxID=167968 RepID=A0A212JEB9_9BACT|nr:hypothetical protein KM92DES2_10969 [uncultured Desulfovibrio sp.]